MHNKRDPCDFAIIKRFILIGVPILNTHALDGDVIYPMIEWQVVECQLKMGCYPGCTLLTIDTFNHLPSQNTCKAECIPGGVVHQTLSSIQILNGHCRTWWRLG